MDVLLACLLGIVIGAILMRMRQRRFFAAQRAKDSEYKQLWAEAVNLLGATGQLTDEQIRSITPSQPTVVDDKGNELHRQSGFSPDRRDIEIARAERGLPPADNLHGMFSSDVRRVHEARLKYGTQR